MGEHNRPIRCTWCRDTHGRRFLCDPAAAALTQSIARGAALTMPTIELAEQLHMSPDPHADKFVGQLVVKAGLIPINDVAHPAIVFTGVDVQMRTLPQWIYVAGDDDLLRQASTLVADVTEMAIRGADAQNGGRRRG